MHSLQGLQQKTCQMWFATPSAAAVRIIHSCLAIVRSQIWDPEAGRTGRFLADGDWWDGNRLSAPAPGEPVPELYNLAGVLATMERGSD